MDKINIMHLPTEILVKILSNMHYKDIINYGATYKRAHKIVATYDDIFKYSVKNTIPDMQGIIEKYNLKYYAELRNFIELRKKVISEISELSLQTWIKPKKLDKKANIYSWAFKNATSFYYVVITLQFIIKKGEEFIETSIHKEQFNMTHIFYSKFYLTRLMHAYLTVKWWHLHRQTLLDPIVVANFFVQWLDPSRIYKDSDVDNMIENLAQEVKAILGNANENLEGNMKKTQAILEKISWVIKEKNLSIAHISSPDSDLRSMNVADIFNNGAVSYPTFMAVYQAVAKRLGVHCEMIVFPNHLFLQWQNDESKTLQKYLVDTYNGALKPKNACPYQENPLRRASMKYNPVNYVESLYQTLNPELISDWSKSNCKSLLTGVQAEIEECYHSNCGTQQIDLHYINDHFTQSLKLVIQSLHIRPEVKEVKVRSSNSKLTYGVGMVCINMENSYVCVIIGWSETPMFKQDNHIVEPHYDVIALDHSARSVTAGKLEAMHEPFRLKEVEEALARYFTHFDGFAYVPNEQKRAEYPQDESIVNTYRTHWETSSLADL